MTAISLTHVSKIYPGASALKDITFNVKKGSVHGFLGPNGAGKSTAMKIIKGLIRPTSGRVKIFGEEISENNCSGHSLIGFLPDNPPLYQQMKVEDYLCFVQDGNSLYQRELKVSLGQVLEECGLENVRGRLIRNLSKGYQQRVGIAQALIIDPQILILDEPTVGLDPVSVTEIRDLIKSLKGERTILFSSHLLHEVELLCSDITILNKGEVLHSGSVEEVRQKFETRQTISVEVNKWSEDLSSKIKESFNIESIHWTQDLYYKLEISLGMEEDIRPQIGRFIVENNCELLAMKREQIDLESIFKIAVKE